MRKKNWFAYTLGLALCFFVRLIPFRAPNVEPILAAQMPFSRVYGAFSGFLFGFASIVLFDFVTQRVGIWTLITAFTYGFLGLGANLYFKNKENSARSYVTFAIFATLFYDAITGLTVGPLFFHESFMIALVGQIPFTALHLLGNISFAYFISPSLYRVLTSERETTRAIISNPLIKLS